MTLELRYLRLPLSAAERAEGLTVLSPAEQQRYTANPRDSFLAGRLLLRNLLADLAGSAPNEVVLDATCPDCGAQHGRVTVPNTGFHVSISHSAEVAVVAVAEVPIGIDVESDPSPEALAAIGTVAGEASMTRWTRVEAVLKADGRGLRVDPKHVYFDEDIAWIDDAPKRYRLTAVDLGADEALGIQVTVASLSRKT